jgi:hypothetical protein
MNFTLRHAIAAILVLLSIAAPVAAGPLEDGNAAYKRGDYKTAIISYVGVVRRFVGHQTTNILRDS